MAEAKAYERWLKNAESWAPEDDWETSQYFEWCQRLSDARKNFKDTCWDIDWKLFMHAKSVCEQEQFRTKDWSRSEKMDTVAKIIMRYPIAYNFYIRRTFEDLEEKQVVARTQEYLVSLGSCMNAADVAWMLQKAADKVPLKDAVKARLVEFANKSKEAGDLMVKWGREVNCADSLTSNLVSNITAAKVEGVLPKISELPKLLDEAQKKEPRSRGLDEDVRQILKLIDTDKKLELLVHTRSDPLLANWWQRLRTDVTCLHSVVHSDELDGLIDMAVTMEKDNLSWEKTIGPAVLAIRRLGSRSAGKDVAALAKYANDHAKPPQL